MNTIQKLMGFLTKKRSNLLNKSGKAGAVPLLIIKKDAYDSNVKEYKSIEEAITDLEIDRNVPTDKIEKLRSSLKNLKYKTSIKIKHGEIIK